jgi:hypothetical protein
MKRIGGIGRIWGLDKNLEQRLLTQGAQRQGGEWGFRFWRQSGVRGCVVFLTNAQRSTPEELLERAAAIAHAPRRAAGGV